MKLKAIFFDVDDTLYSSSEFSAMARLNSIKGMIAAGLRMEVKESLLVLNRLISKFPSNYKFLFNEFLTEVGNNKYRDSNPSIIIAAGVAAYHNTKTNWLKPYPDVFEVIKILSKTTSLCLGIISSGLAVKQSEKIFRCGLHKFLDSDALFFSENLKVDKPSKKFFQIPCSKLGLNPREVMYVGDRPIHDVKPVKEIGMISVLNRRSGKYLDVKSNVKPDFIIHDFWELLNIIDKKLNPSAS